MSNVRINTSAPMSIDPSQLEDPAAVSREDGGGASAASVSGARGTSGRGPDDDTQVSRDQDGGSCLDEGLRAAAACAAAALAGSAGGVGAIVAGVACVGSTLSWLECVQERPAAPR